MLERFNRNEGSLTRSISNSRPGDAVNMIRYDTNCVNARQPSKLGPGLGSSGRTACIQHVVHPVESKTSSC